MRALFLIPGDAASQLEVLPAAAATAQQLGFALQVACSPAAAPVWKLLPAVEKVIPFDFGQASLADWANLLGSVRDPDFQACVNLVRGRQVDLMLSMSHIPTRVAAGGFSATETVAPPPGVWAAQAMEAYLRPLGVALDAAAYRLPLPPDGLAKAGASLPPGDGPLLLLAPSGASGDWPSGRWAELPGRIRATLPSLRCIERPPASAAGVLERACDVASVDVVLASDSLTSELALLCGVPVVALGRPPSSLPQREGVRGLGRDGDASDLTSDAVLAALGLG